VPAKARPASNTPQGTLPIHPGQYVRETILKTKKMSVTDAAKLVADPASQIS
jgi:plasmid maintenance system antidote protein VapI